MEISEEVYGDVLVEIVNMNRASLNEAEILKKKLDVRIGVGYNKIIVDLSQCEFIDSTFLGVLVSSLKKTVKLNGDLRLVGFQPPVKSMFELTRLYKVFEAYPDRKEAVNSFK